MIRSVDFIRDHVTPKGDQRVVDWPWYFANNVDCRPFGLGSIEHRQLAALDLFCEYMGFEIESMKSGGFAAVFLCPKQNVALRISYLLQNFGADLPFMLTPLATFIFHKRPQLRGVNLLEVLPLVQTLDMLVENGDQKQIVRMNTAVKSRMKEITQIYGDFNQQGDLIPKSLKSFPGVLPNWTAFKYRRKSYYFMVDSVSRHDRSARSLYQAYKTALQSGQNDWKALHSGYENILGEDPVAYAKNLKQRFLLHECPGLTYIGPHRLHGIQL